MFLCLDIHIFAFNIYGGQCHLKCDKHLFVLRIYKSEFRLFCVLDSTCKWYHTMFIFLCLT